MPGTSGLGWLARPVHGGAKSHVRSGRSGLTFSVSDDHRHYQLRLVHDSPERHSEGVPELPSFMDGSRNFRIDVRREPLRRRESRDEILEPSCVHTILREEFGEGTLDPERGEDCGCSMT